MTDNTPNTRRSLSTIDADIAITQATIDRPLADITALEREVARLSAETILDPLKRPDLYDATEAVKAAKQAVIERARAQQHLLVLNSEKAQVIAEERAERVRTANQRLATAENTYVEAAKASVRAYRAYVNTYFQAGDVRPNHGAPLGAPGFDMFLQPGSLGSASSITAAELLYWERQEQGGRAA